MAGSEAAFRATAMTKGRSTPASIAAATAAGIAPTARESAGTAPVSAMSPPARMKAPTASWMSIPEVAAMSAAPGVDQASTTGTRVPQLRAAEPRPLATDTAATQDAVCAASAPTAAAAASTSAIVEP